MELLITREDVKDYNLKNFDFTDSQMDEIIDECQDAFSDSGCFNGETLTLAIENAMNKHCLYKRKWIKYSVCETMGHTLYPCKFTYSELLDQNSNLCDFGFADVCEQHLRDSKIGEIIFIPPSESDDGCYILKRIK